MSMTTINANSVRKGTKGRLRNGWPFTIADNSRGVTRLAKVEGFYNEIGSIYIWDIAYVLIDGEQVQIEMTPAQEKSRRAVKAAGF